MIKLNGNNVNVGVFPNGESYADIPQSYLNRTEKFNNIFLKFESDEDLIMLEFIKDFVDTHCSTIPCNLIMPYIPYSRMDRQEEKRLFTLKSVCKMINRMNFASVQVMEPHSEVSVALLDRVVVENKSADLTLKAMRKMLNLVGDAWFREDTYLLDTDMCQKGLFKRAEEAGIYLVYPDAGAEKRYKKQIKYPKVLTCSKERDFNTGNITSIKVNGFENANDCKCIIIVDDLCSKGGTFVGSAKVLRECLDIEDIYLVVTHCENTIYDGSVLSGTEVTRVFTTNSILNIPKSEDITNFDKAKLVVEELY